MHFDTNELLQQGPEPVFNEHVSLLNTSPDSSHDTKICSVNPLYYVSFTTCTLCASFILFQGFNTADAVNTISLLCGFLIIFSGVYLLNLSRDDPNGERLLSHKYEDAAPTDGIAGIQTRISMQLRRSVDAGRHSNGSSGFARSDRERLIHEYDAENGPFNLGDLAEDSDDESDKGPPQNKRRNSGAPNGSARRPSGPFVR